MRRLLLPVAAVAAVLSACSGAFNDAAGEAATTATTASTTPPTTSSEAPASSTPVATTTTLAATTTTSSTTTTTTTTLPPIVLGFAGDTSFTHGLADRDPLGDIADVLAGPDLMVVNLETTVAEASVGRAIQKRFQFKSPPKTGGILVDSGVDVAALANNHALDYGPAAVLRTIEILEEAGLRTAGTGPDPATAYRGARIDVKGWDVAVLSFTRVPCDSPEPGESFIPEVAWACPDFDEATVDAVTAASDADLVVVMIHWGIQSRSCPADHQPDLARRWIAAGADVVVGSHPHVLQGVERIGEAWVIHSTGNFAFPSAREASSYSAVFELAVDSVGTELSAIPVRILGGRPVPATTSRDRILDILTERSFGYGFEDSGVAVATDAPGVCPVS